MRRHVAGRGSTCGAHRARRRRADQEPRREGLSFRPLDALSRDTRYAFRTMRKQKTFRPSPCFASRSASAPTRRSSASRIRICSARCRSEPRRLGHPAVGDRSAHGRTRRGACRAAAESLPSTRVCAATAGPTRNRAVPGIRASSSPTCPGASRRRSSASKTARGRRPRTLRRRQLFPQSRGRRSSGTDAGGRRRPLRCVAGRRALVGLQHGTLRLGRGGCRTIDPYQRRRVHSRRRRAAVVLRARPGAATQLRSADEVRPVARGGEPASRATRRRGTGCRDARRQHARDVRKSEIYWVAAWARLRPGVGREQVEAALRPQFDQFFARMSRTKIRCECTAARGCSGNRGSRRHAQKLWRNSARAVRDGRGDSHRRVREHRELAARTRDRAAARNGRAHEPRCGALERHPATTDRELAARVDRRDSRRRVVDCGYASLGAAADGWERRVVACAS